MSVNLSAFEKDLKNEFENDTQWGDVKQIASNIIATVTDFCTTNNFGSVKTATGSHAEVIVCNESMSPDSLFNEGGLSATHIAGLVSSCKIPKMQQLNCAKAVANVFNKYFAAQKDGAALFGTHNIKKNISYGTDQAPINFGDLFPVDMISLFNVVASEDFGQGISKVIPDLRMAITVTIMQFHQGITARLVPIRTTNEPVIQYTRQDYKIYNVADPDSEDKDLIEVSKNPKPVTNELIRIIPRTANDDATNPALVRDGVVRPNVDANLLLLGIDDTKYGHGRINRTDLIAEAPEVDQVFFTITSDGTTEEFAITVPYALRKLVMENNAAQASIRSANIEFATFINKNTKLSNGTISTLLAPLAASEGLNVAFTIKPTVNLKGNSKYLYSITAKPWNTLSTTVSADLTTFFGTLGATPATFVGITYDARYDEQNIRKSQIATRVQTRQMVQSMPPAKNYLIETAIGQSEEDNGASHIVNVIKIGQDDKTLTTISRVMGHIETMTSQMFANPLQKGIDPGHHYVAGSMVRPRVYKYTDFDVDDVVSMKDSDRTSDIRAAFQMKLQFIIEQLLQDTMLTQQLPGGQAPTFRIATSRPVLNTLFAVPHIHNHLDNGTVTPSYDGIEFRRVLDNGVVLEFVTSLFDYMIDTVELIPVIPGAPDSILNWGHNWDYGTVLGNYNHSMDTAAWNRTFASVREVTLPTNPMGVVFTVKNIDKVVRLA